MRSSFVLLSVMQHLGVLTAAGVVIARRRGRDRVNYFNPAPLREWYERWVQPLADADSARLLAVKREAEKQEHIMPEAIEPIRTVRLAYELRIAASAQRTFEVMTQQSLDWNPRTYGGDRARRVVLEPAGRRAALRRLGRWRRAPVRAGHRLRPAEALGDPRPAGPGSHPGLRL